MKSVEKHSVIAKLSKLTFIDFLLDSRLNFYLLILTAPCSKTEGALVEKEEDLIVEFSSFPQI